MPAMPARVSLEKPVIFGDGEVVVSLAVVSAGKVFAK